MVSTSQKISFRQLEYGLSLKTGLHQYQGRFPLRGKTPRGNVSTNQKLFPLVGMKDFVEIQYSVFWKLCFDQSHFWLVETIIGIRGKQFSKKELIFCLVEIVFFGQRYFAASRNYYQNKEKRVLRERAHSCQWTTDFCGQWKTFLFPIFWKPLPVCYSSGGKVFFKEIVIFGWWKQILELLMASTSRKKL